MGLLKQPLVGSSNLAIPKPLTCRVRLPRTALASVHLIWVTVWWAGQPSFKSLFMEHMPAKGVYLYHRDLGARQIATCVRILGWGPVIGPRASDNQMKSAIRRMLRKVGYDIRRYHETTSETARLSRMLNYHKINLVLDVGANVGQFAISLRSDLAYRGRIVSFEPLKGPHAALLESSQKDPLWIVAPRAAVGAIDGEIEINVSGNSVSSSILPMLDSHTEAAPESRYSGVENVPLRRLDSFATQYIEADSKIFLKVDTQGYERQVLEGAPAILRKAIGVALEVSLTPLYQGDQLMPETVHHMSAIGFDLWGVSPAFVDERSGRSLQFDAIFFRS